MNLLFFFKPGCPYCRQAEKLIAALCEEHPEFRKIKIRRIDETRESAYADSFDYWYVPSFFSGGKKLYEASPTESENTMRQKLQAVLQTALSQQGTTVSQ